MRFVGSKGGSGIAQWIISAMPYHRLFVEGFAGTGKITKTKLPAARTLWIERDRQTISDYLRRYTETHRDVAIKAGDAFKILPTLKLDRTGLVYLDPPYLQESRSWQRRSYYRHELLTVEDHKRLLDLARTLPCNVMISGYWSELYASVLDGWRSDFKWTVTRRGKAVKEWLWMNFPPPALLHDTRFVGTDFTDRQRIKRKVARWSKKFLAMPAHERGAIWDALNSAVRRPEQTKMTVCPAT